MTDEERQEREKFFTPEESITFNMLDKGTINKLIRDGDIILPHKDLDKIKDERWNTKQLTSKLLQGILNGDSIPKIANSFTDVIGNNKTSATRNARTMVTSAQNAGRLDSYKNLESQGVIQKKIWMSTPDDRTRPTHVDIDGEEQDINDQFSNGCMYPGDGKGPAEEVWNCRCTMRDHIVGFKKADGNISYVKGEKIIVNDEQVNEKNIITTALQKVIPKTSQELTEKWGIPVEGLQGDVIKNIDDALTYMQDEFGIDPKEYIAMIDNKNPERLRNYEAYYSTWDKCIHLHKEYSGGKQGSLSPEIAAHEIMHALNGYLSTLETKNHSTHLMDEIADEIIKKVYSENGYKINKRTNLPFKEDIFRTITSYGSTNSLEALADATKLMYQRDILGMNIKRENNIPQKIHDEVLRRLRNDIGK